MKQIVKIPSVLFHRQIKVESKNLAYALMLFVFDHFHQTIKSHILNRFICKKPTNKPHILLFKIQIAKKLKIITLNCNRKNFSGVIIFQKLQGITRPLYHYLDPLY